RFAREDFFFLRCQRIRSIASLVLQQMPQVFIGGDPEQPAAGLETGRKLEVGEVAAAVGAAQPVLLLGKIVVADAGAVQPAEGILGGTKIGDITMRLCKMQRDTIDEAADQRAAASPQQLGTDLEPLSQRQRPPLAGEEMLCKYKRPPRHLIKPAQHGID